MKEEKVNPSEMGRKQVDLRCQKIPMRTAALVLGIGGVAEATKLRGIYP